jgi:hypothetical protein
MGSVELRKVQSTGHVACMNEETINICRKPEGNRSRGIQDGRTGTKYSLQK